MTALINMEQNVSLIIVVDVMLIILTLMEMKFVKRFLLRVRLFVIFIVLMGMCLMRTDVLLVLVTLLFVLLLLVKCIVSMDGLLIKLMDVKYVNVLNLFVLI
jgi:hypothetical protein